MAYIKGEVFLKKESEWGTAVNPSTPTTSIDEVIGLDSKFERGLSNSLAAVNPVSAPYPTEISYHTATPTADIDFVYNNAMPFAVILGGVKGEADQEAAPYTWRITPESEPIPVTASFMAKGENSKLDQLVGGYAKSLSFSIGLETPASGTLDLIGKDLKIGSQFSPPENISIDPARAWKAHEFTYSIGDNTEIDYITGIDFTIARNIETGHSLASRVPSTIYPGKFSEVSGTINSYIPDSAAASEIEEMVLGGSGISETLSPQDLVIDKRYEAGQSGADTVKITLKGLQFSDYSATFPLDTRVSYRFSFTARAVSEVLWQAPVPVTNWGSVLEE